MVITVIILLILAGISIASLTGNGLFEKAKLAKEKQENEQIKENEIISDYEKKMEEYLYSSRNENMDFSLQEKQIGTWIDGSAIYSKTIEIKSLNSGWNVINHDIANLGKIIDYKGKIYCCRGSDYYSTDINGGVGYEAKNRMYCMVGKDTVEIYFGSTYSFDSNSYAFVTIYYTKVK